MKTLKRKQVQINQMVSKSTYTEEADSNVEVNQTYSLNQRCKNSLVYYNRRINA